MSLPVPAYNDGAIPYGSFALAFTRPAGGTPAGALGTYVLENFSIERSTNVIKRSNEVNEPNGSVGQNAFTEATATVQLATASSHFILPGDTMILPTAIEIPEGAAETFIVTKSSQPFEQAGYYKQSLSFIKKYN